MIAFLMFINNNISTFFKVDIIDVKLTKIIFVKSMAPTVSS